MSVLTRVCVAAAALMVACGHRGTAPGDESWYDDLPQRDPLAGYSAAYVLTWQGQRIGSAVEELTPRVHSGGGGSARGGPSPGLRLTRRENIVIRRGDAVVPYETAIAIDTDEALRADEVRVRMRAGATTTVGRAIRQPDGSWLAQFGDQPAHRAPEDAVPVELVPLLVARSPERMFRGAVMLTGHGFSLARIRVAPAAADGDEKRPLRHVVAVTETPLGELQSHVELAADGTVLRVREGNSVGSLRVDPVELRDPFDPPEVVDNASIAVLGSAPRKGPLALAIDDVEREAPPALPGQLVIAEGSHWTVLMTGGDEGGSHAEATVDADVGTEIRDLAVAIVRAAAAVDERDEVAALTLATARLLENDLSAPAVEPRAVLALGRGDCTAHAALFAALAAARGIPTRLVTGYRLTGRRLVRHRWALALASGNWMAVDPTHGEAPARPGLLGLAVHGASSSELAGVDDIAFAGLSGARAQFIQR